MKKLLAVLCAVVLFNGCMEGQGGGAQFEESDVQSDNAVEVPPCETHAECFPDHSFCVMGVCEGEPWGGVPVEEVSEADVLQEVEEDVSEEVTVPECTKDIECPLGHSCNNGQCQQNATPKCINDDDCGTGASCECKQGGWQMCTTHVCENFSCGETIVAEQCEFGCDGGQCLPKSVECETDADCAELDSITCDDSVWLRTVTGNCFEGQCNENAASFFACEFGCAEGACQPDPEVPECLIDADCVEGGNTVCTDSFVLKSTWQFPKCMDGECEQAVVTYQCAIPCGVGCYECWKNSDCDDDDACTADYCGDHECMYENACACGSDANCDDGNACTSDSCASGNCKNVAIMNCVQCTDTDECGGVATGCWGNTYVVLTNFCGTLGYCTASSVDCEFGCDANLGCKSQCESAGDCADVDDCTNDSCAGGKCLHDNQCYLFGDEESPFYMKKCGADAECIGTKFGGHCVADIETGNSWCQPCFNSPKGDANIACDNFEEKCTWGFVGDDGFWASVFDCVECVSNKDCDDGNPCTEDTCGYGECEHGPIKGCFACNVDTDCKFMQVCYEYEGVDTEWTWSGKCLSALEGDVIGKCEITEKKCKTSCAGDACEELECESDADCGFGQYCTDKSLCGWIGDLQCKFECPAGKKYAWVMSAKPDEAVESGTGIFKVSPTTLCMWGWKNPAFKFNCWDGTNGNGAWSDGDKAIVTCNDENFTIAPDPIYGSQGVQVLTFVNHVCGF